MAEEKVILSKQKRVQGYPVKADIGRNTKLLIEKGLITQAEFTQKVSAERAGYQAMLGNIKKNER